MNGEEKPVAWRVKDYADGWIFFLSEPMAKDVAEPSGALIEPLYTRAPINRPSPEAGESGLIERLRRVSDRRSLTIGAIWTIAGEAADEITRLQAELAEARDQDRLIMLLAEVRRASGVGHKPMLDEVPGAIRARFEGIEARATQAEAQRDALAEALTRLRDCDFVITLADRMDAVRDIARQALASLSPAKDEDPTHD